MQGMQETWVQSLDREDPLEEEMATHSSFLAWMCTEDSGGLQSLATQSWTWLRIHMEKEMATHSSVLAWRIPGTGEPGGLPSVGLRRVGHDWSDLAAAENTHTDIKWHNSPSLSHLTHHLRQSILLPLPTLVQFSSSNSLLLSGPTASLSPHSPLFST